MVWLMAAVFVAIVVAVGGRKGISFLFYILHQINNFESLLPVLFFLYDPLREVLILRFVFHFHYLISFQRSRLLLLLFQNFFHLYLEVLSSQFQKKKKTAEERECLRSADTLLSSVFVSLLFHSHFQNFAVRTVDFLTFNYFVCTNLYITFFL